MSALLTNAWLGILILLAFCLYLWRRQNALERTVEFWHAHHQSETLRLAMQVDAMARREAERDSFRLMDTTARETWQGEAIDRQEAR